MRLSNTMMMNESLLPTGKKAFTLAEVLITLSILGVVAALTIPSLVNRQSDLAAQVKLKKAISNYEDVIGVYMAENEAQNAASMLGLASGGTPAQTNCDKLTDYFKVVTGPTLVDTYCDFVTADGVAWRFDPATGNATVTDSSKGGAGRYAVAMWNANGRVNTTGKADNVSNVTAIVDSIYGGNALIDTTRKMTAAHLFLQGSSSDAKGKLYCVGADVTATVADGTFTCASS